MERKERMDIQVERKKKEVGRYWEKGEDGKRVKWVSFSTFFPIYFRKPGKLRAIPHSLTSLKVPI